MKTQATLSQPSAVPGSPLLQVSGALFGIIAFILIAAWLAKRVGLAGKTAGARGLKVSASTTVGPRERVVIVDVEDARHGLKHQRITQAAARPCCGGRARRRPCGFSVRHEEFA